MPYPLPPAPADTPVATGALAGLRFVLLPTLLGYGALFQFCHLLF